MNILNKIIAHKKQSLIATKQERPIAQLEKSVHFNQKPVSMKQFLTAPGSSGIIAEIKRSSPSTGVINDSIDVATLSSAYIKAGAAGLSVLTDLEFFGGTYKDVESARAHNTCPILRKDFTVDEYQIVEAKSIGASCILLIAACLSPQECASLAAFAKSLDLEVLLEIRDKEEIDSHAHSAIDLIGVNNRDLRNFKTDINNSLELYEHLPKSAVKISESGIQNAEQMQILKNAGYNGFLIGGFFMKHADPSLSCKTLIENFKKITQ